MSIGIVVERRETGNKWVDAVWKPVAVFAGAPDTDDWREIRSGDGWTLFHAGTTTLELHRTDAESYKYNLSTRTPSVFVALEPAAGPHPWRVALATASAYEGESYVGSEDLIVEAVPMPDDIADWVRGFAEAHFKPEPFRKRKRDRPPAMEEARFGKDPISRNKRDGRKETDSG